MASLVKHAIEESKHLESPSTASSKGEEEEEFFDLIEEEVDD